MRAATAVLAWALALPALAQLPKDTDAPVAPALDAAQDEAPPPPPQIEIPGVDVPAKVDPAAAPAQGAPAPAAAPAPEEPEPPSGPEYLPTAPIQVARGIARGGGYFGLGIGFGTADFAPRSFADSGAAHFSIRAGKIFSDNLLVGPEAVFTAQYDRWETNTLVGTGLSSLMMQVMVFPVIDQPFNVSTGLGWGSGLQVSRLNPATDGTPVVAQGDDGLSWMAGLGWDFFAGRGWNLGLQARYDGVHFFSSERNTRAFALQIWLNSY